MKIRYQFVNKGRNYKSVKSLCGPLRLVGENKSIWRYNYILHIIYIKKKLQHECKIKNNGFFSINEWKKRTKKSRIVANIIIKFYVY